MPEIKRRFGDDGEREEKAKKPPPYLVYDPETKSFRTSDTPPDLDERLETRLEDLQVDCSMKKETDLLILSREFLVDAPTQEGCHAIRLHCWENSDVYTTLRPKERPGVIQGALYIRKKGETIDVMEIGQQEDRVRIIMRRRNSGGGEGALTQSKIKAYTWRGDAWRKARVSTVDVEGSLFSRFGGLLETDALADRRVFIVGQGSGGAPIAMELAKSAVMHLCLMDHDRFEVGNVMRHDAGLSDVGRLKVEYMKERILNKNPFAQIRTWAQTATWKNKEQIREIVQQSDLVICATDERESRRVLNLVCVEENTPLILAAAFRRAYGGQVLFVRPRVTPCYECFLHYLPEAARDQEVSNQAQAEKLAYSDRPVAIEPGLSTDIAPISLMVVKLAIQELLRGKATTFRSLDEDLTAPWHLWLNRREAGTQYESLKPLECNLNGMHVLRWYGIDLKRYAGCEICGDYLSELAAQEGLTVSAEEPVELTST